MKRLPRAVNKLATQTPLAAPYATNQSICNENYARAALGSNGETTWLLIRR